MGKGIYVFDYDGTLFDTMTVEVYAFNKTCEYFSQPFLSNSEIAKLIGYTIEDIAFMCLETKDEKIIFEFTEIFTDYEIEATLKQGKLFSKVQALLDTLSNQNFIMEICTHGNNRYLEAHNEKFNLDKYFCKINTTDTYNTKTQALRDIYDRHDADFGVMTGDRKVDIDSGIINNYITVGAAYGFGKDEIKHADYIANNAEELEKILLKINKNNS